MSNPKDATFEGLPEEPTTKIEVPQAPPAKAPTCRIITPPSTDACGKPATHRLIFGDGEKTTACVKCALYMRQVAESHNTIIKAEHL